MEDTRIKGQKRKDVVSNGSGATLGHLKQTSTTICVLHQLKGDLRSQIVQRLSDQKSVFPARNEPLFSPLLWTPFLNTLVESFIKSHQMLRQVRVSRQRGRGGGGRGRGCAHQGLTRE